MSEKQMNFPEWRRKVYTIFLRELNKPIPWNVTYRAHYRLGYTPRQAAEEFAAGGGRRA